MQLKDIFLRLTSRIVLLIAIIMKKIVILLFIAFSLFVTGQAQTIVYQEDFNSGISSWSVYSSGTATQSWDTTSTHYAFSFDGTPFIITYDWSGITMVEEISSPTFNAATSNPLFLTYEFSFMYQSTALQGLVDVYDGSAWQNVRTFSGTDTVGIDTIDISAYANANMQVRFTASCSGGYNWEHDFMIDNVKVYEMPATAISENDSQPPYPNPSENALTLKDINEADIDFIGIYSVSGDLVKVCEKKTVIDISDLEAGSYILRIIVNGAFTDDMLFIKQ